MSKQLTVIDWGCLAYGTALARQEEAVRLRLQGKITDTLFLVEHPPVITFGRGGKSEHLLASKEELDRRGVELFHITRGGDVTFHGPGQLVAYLVADLTGRGRDLHRFLRELEESVIDFLADYHIKGERMAGKTGVWVGGRKICAMGVAVRNWITFHGLALNVSAPLDYFSLIVPCGLADPVTNMELELKEKVDFEKAKEHLAASIAAVFGYETVQNNDAAEFSRTSRPLIPIPAK
ncbi:MAG: lipoyl(octanoyl) transferase LipB [candidate division Zixibacteria bacterium]|nr:lipoyl(octanoyl) transferase LipB [candidate division Zixibacteria bacterium]